ncbi:MAG: hypothetical protein K2O62_03550 [Clostridia bacterium]|nr:hypothetical protein [Clostridia bacterium]
MKKTPNQEIISSDIMRYKTNKLPASLALLGIVFNCLYFCLLYGFKESFFSQWKIGFSVILTLVFLLVTFLCSEGIKSYKKNYSIVLLILAVVQVIRMFGLPLEALRHDVGLASTDVPALKINYFFVDLPSGVSYTILLVWLAASAACLVAAAVIGYINCARLESFQKKVSDGEVVIEDVIAKMDEEDAAAAKAEGESVKTIASVEQAENVSASEEEGK